MSQQEAAEQIQTVQEHEKQESQAQNSLQLENNDSSNIENVEQQNNNEATHEADKIIQNQEEQAVNQQEEQKVNISQEKNNSSSSPIKDFNPQEYSQSISNDHPKEITIQSGEESVEQQQHQQQKQKEGGEEEQEQQGGFVFKGPNQGYEQSSHRQHVHQYKEQWSEIYEHEMIAHSSMDRKRQNLEMLREWDRKRAYFLNVHRSLIETVISQVDIKMQASNQFMQFIIHYFQNKAKQELQYARQPIPKPDAALMNNELAKSIYGHLKKGLQLLDDGNFEHAKKVSQFAYVLEHDILQELLVVDYNQSMSSIGALQNDINAFKRQMSNLNEITSRKSGKVAQVYNMSTPKTGYKKLTTKPKDLYRTQLNFLRNANIQTETQRKLARSVLQFWEGAKEIEINRGKSIAKALQLFKESFIECYGDNKSFQESVEFISNGFDEQNIEDQFSLQQIFTQQDIDFLTDQLGKKSGEGEAQDNNIPKLTFNDVIPFFENFIVDMFDNRMLVLKDLKVQRQFGVAGQYKDSHLVITADNYLHCFDSIEINSQILAHHFAKPNFSLSLNKSILRRVSTTNFLVELSIQQSGFLNYLAGSDKYFFNFKNSDEIEELAQFINSLN